VLVDLLMFSPLSDFISCTRQAEDCNLKCLIPGGGVLP